VLFRSDGVHAVFDDPADAVAAMLALQRSLTAGCEGIELQLRVRIAAHVGPSEARDGDYFGPTLNRCARLTAAAHGGQVLLSQALADRVQGRLPPGASLRALGSVRLRDLAEPEDVHQLLHPALRTEFAPLQALTRALHNLVLPMDSFVGRERERAELRERLARGRLLTLLGVGGIGKSRLAVQLGVELLADYPDGVWLVELASLSDPQRVPHALAGVLGVKTEGHGRSLREALQDHVRGRRLLLILDNCEHLGAACADLAKRLLQAGAGLTLLATSRDALRLAGEIIYAVPALDTPTGDGERTGDPDGDPVGAIDPARLARHAAARLFIDRAGAAQPQFRLNADNAAAVAAICRRLDGIPLALELAAARMRALSAQTIAARLDDRFRLLVSGDQTVLPRQRTLRALIDWSHELLSEPERVLFRRLSVFAGGCTLESAQAVAAGDRLDAAAVSDLLPRLVEQSLVGLDSEGQRYQMLETVRAYAAEALARAGETEALRDRHLVHVADLAEAIRPHLLGPEQARWLARLDAESGNMLAARGHCFSAADGDAQGTRLLLALRYRWAIRGEFNLGLTNARALLERPGLARRDVRRCDVLMAAGQFGFMAGQHAQAQPYLQESLDIAREIGDEARVSYVLQPLGLTCLALGDHEAAAGHLDDAVRRAEARGQPRELATALNARTAQHRVAGRHDLAEPLCRRAVALFRECGDPMGVGLTLLSLGMVRLTRGAGDDATPLWHEAADLALQTGSPPLLLCALDLAIGLAAAQGRWADAAICHGAAQAHLGKTGCGRDAADQAFVDAAAQTARAALGAAGWAAHEERGARRPAAAWLAELTEAGTIAAGPVVVARAAGVPSA
jgi:predicted ATPase